MNRKYYLLSPPDDKPLLAMRRDLSGGANTRQHEQMVGENQATKLDNVDINTAGKRIMRAGITLVEDLGNDAGTGLFGYEPTGGTNLLVATHGQKLETNSNPAAGSSNFVERKDDFTTSLQTTIVKAIESDEADVFIATNGTDNCFRFEPDNLGTPQDLGDTNTSPPLTTVMTWFRNRLWALKDNKLYYAGAIPTDFSDTFNRTTNYYTVPTGEEKAIVGLRDTGMVLMGKEAIWGFNPSVVPAATDKPELLLDIGCFAQKTAVQVADDVFFLAADGVRGLFRTINDKMQAGESYPLSYPLKTEVDNINWTYAHKACAVYFDNRYIISLPTGTSTYNNEVWIYYPAIKSWVTISGWNIADFAKLDIGGEDKLFGIDSNDGSVYRMFSGVTDAGTAIAYDEQSRAEDFQQPLIYKYGGEFKVKSSGGNGSLVISANPDGSGWTQLGTLDLAVTGVSFPTTFPVSFPANVEVNGVWHLDVLGKFKRCKFKIYCNDSGSIISILESIVVTFPDEYLSEE